MKIEVRVSVGLVGCDVARKIEVDDDSTDAEIETDAREAVFEIVEWNWVRL